MKLEMCDRKCRAFTTVTCARLACWFSLFFTYHMRCWDLCRIKKMTHNRRVGGGRCKQISRKLKWNSDCAKRKIDSFPLDGFRETKIKYAQVWVKFKLYSSAFWFALVVITAVLEVLRFTLFLFFATFDERRKYWSGTWISSELKSLFGEGSHHHHHHRNIFVIIIRKKSFFLITTEKGKISSVRLIHSSWSSDSLLCYDEFRKNREENV